MEPLDPRMREALKRTNPGLTDEDIDRSEEILSRLQDLDSEQDADEIRILRAELDNLMRDRMPRYQEVVRSFAAASRQEALSSRPSPKVFEKPRKQS